MMKVNFKPIHTSVTKNKAVNEKINTALVSFKSTHADNVSSYKLGQTLLAYSQLSFKGITNVKNKEVIKESSQAKPLEDYINCISDPKLKKLCIRMLEESPPEFFANPEHIRKWHPGDENGDDAIYIHLKRTMTMALWACNRHGIEDKKMLDAVMTVALIHDSPGRIYVDENGSHQIDFDHAPKNAKYIEKVMKDMGIDNETIELVCTGVGLHMGRWEKHADKSWLKRFEKNKDHPIVHIIREADFYCSRFNNYLDYDIASVRKILDM